jgi:hypothetical protein
MDRKKYNTVFTHLSIYGGVISLLIGLVAYFDNFSISKTAGAVLIGIWTLAPPIFFWVDWVNYSGELDTDAKRDFAKHTHDLGRNIWIAFAAILVFLFGIPFAGSSGAERTACGCSAPLAESSTQSTCSRSTVAATRQ